MMFTRIFEIQLANRILDSFGETCTFPLATEQLNAADFFIDLYINTWKISNPKEQKELLGKLLNSLDNEDTAIQFFNELYTAAAFIRRGFEVNLCDYDSNGQSVHDMTVIAKYLKLHIEVKTVSLFTKRGIGREILSQALHITLDSMDSISNGRLYKLNLRYIGDRTPERNTTLTSIRNLCSNVHISKQTKSFNNKCWKISVREASQQEVSEFMPKNIEAALLHTMPEGEMISQGKYGIATINIETQSNLEKAILDHIDKAVHKQLPDSGYCSIHIFVAGLNIIDRDKAGIIFSIINPNTITNKIESIYRKYKNKRLAGVRIFGDPMVMSRDNGITSIQSHSLLIGNKKFSEDLTIVNNYFFPETGKPPEERIY